MPSKRQVLETLPRQALVELLDAFELDVADRRVRANLIDALVSSRRATLSEILDRLYRDELKAVCRELDLDDSGRAKAAPAISSAWMGQPEGRTFTDGAAASSWVSVLISAKIP
ncbi:hypothetical protein ACFL51_00295 [Myxococcota bacterium]